MNNQPADRTQSKRHRILSKAGLLRVTVLAFAIAAVAGAFLLQLAQGYLDAMKELAESDPVLAAERVVALLRIVLTSTVVFSVAVGAFVAWYGVRTVRSDCFPPPGSWIIEGREVLTGEKARRMGWIQILLGILMAAAACGAVYRAWAVVQKLL